MKSPSLTCPGQALSHVSGNLQGRPPFWFLLFASLLSCTARSGFERINRVGDDGGPATTGNPGSNPGGSRDGGGPSSSGDDAGDGGAAQGDSGPAPNSLVLTGPALVSPDTCTGPYRVRVVDESGELNDLTDDVLVSLTGNGSGSFFTDVDCALTTLTSLVLGPAANPVAFYFRNGAREELTFDAASPPLVRDSLAVYVWTQPIFWLRADDLDGSKDQNRSFSDTDPVTQWADVSGHAYAATSPPGYEPVYRTARLGGLPAVDFSNAFLEADDVTTPLRDLSGATDGMTIIYVKNVHDKQARQFWVGFYGASPDSDYVRAGISYESNEYNQFVIFTGYRLMQASTGNNLPQDFVVHSITVDNAATRAELWEQQLLQAEWDAIPIPPDFAAMVHFVIGQDWDDDGSGGFEASDFFDGELAEILVFDNVLNTIDRIAIEGMLRSRYGI